jgi:murein DD-endopeptidase MepM/ murein hydrolase activator NlpD
MHWSGGLPGPEFGGKRERGGLVAILRKRCGGVLNIRNLKRRIARLLPSDREFIVRTGDRVAYLRLPRWGQLALGGVIALALVWMAIATHHNVNYLALIANRDSRIAATEEARRDVEKALATLQKDHDLSLRQAAIGHERAESLSRRNRELEQRIGNLLQEAESAQSTYASSTTRRAALKERITGLQQEIDALVAERAQAAAAAQALRDTVAQQESDRQELLARIATLQPMIEEMATARAAASDRMAALRDELAQRVAERDEMANERNRAAAERDVIASHFTSLGNQLASLETAQEQIVSRFDSQTSDSIELVEKTIALTGVDVDRLLGRLGPLMQTGGSGGVGGPFIASVEDAGSGLTADLAENISAIESRVERWRGLQALLAHMPLAVPLDNFHVSSTFGRRIDAITGRPAMHEGIDFTSDRRADVRTTSPGRVSFVGWRGGYGKMVEIDHGLGIRTRYAHLSRMYVKKGQKVDFRDKLGQIGNSGRSTGEHLHYEVLLDSRALDPANFIKAGQYVFKN